MKFDIHESVIGKNGPCRLGYVVIRNTEIQGAPPALTQKFFQLRAAIASVANVDGLMNVPKLASVLNIYNQAKFDMTRYSLASEELIRRILHHKESYYVNSMVTVANYCSIKYLLPISLYDLDQITGNIEYGLSAEESYINISGDVVPIEGQPFLSDDKGAFGNPCTDTRRTAVTLSTNSILAVVYADKKVSREQLAQILDFTSKMIIRYSGGSVETQEIIDS